jgi:hypothetical protein
MVDYCSIQKGEECCEVACKALLEEVYEAAFDKMMHAKLKADD